jgi:hypothetical protein
MVSVAHFANIKFIRFTAWFVVKKRGELQEIFQKIRIMAAEK